MSYLSMLDYAIMVAYFVMLLLLGVRFKNNKNSKDYFLGERSFGWFPLTLSVMATQLSAISYISAPAFVGYREGGGMQWLAYELGVPLAMIVVMTLIIPPIYKMGIVSIYEYLERRFDKSSRVLISLVFQISRSFATGIMIYALSLITKVVTGFDVWLVILLIGVVTLIYSSLGGMKAVIYGDVIQMLVMIGGIFVCLSFAFFEIGGVSNFFDNVDSTRLTAIHFDRFGLSDDGGFGFWPMLIGGFFLYVSYYGTDQTQSQRLLASSDLKTVKKTLLANGLARFPITLLYCVMGLAVGTLLTLDASFQNEIGAAYETHKDFIKSKTDLLMVIFIVKYLPHGVIGLLLVAITAAAMSSLSSTINSLSAVTMEDLISRGKIKGESYMRYSVYCSIGWGLVCMAFALTAGDIADTVIEAINKIGSVFYGPILAMFVLGATTKRVGAKSANIGLVVGLLINIYLWLFVPQIFWFWWNFIGTVTTVGIALLASLYIKKKSIQEKQEVFSFRDLKIKEAVILVGAFILMLIISISIPYLF